MEDNSQSQFPQNPQQVPQTTQPEGIPVQSPPIESQSSVNQNPPIKSSKTKLFIILGAILIIILVVIALIYFFLNGKSQVSTQSAANATTAPQTNIINSSPTSSVTQGNTNSQRKAFFDVSFAPPKEWKESPQQLMGTQDTIAYLSPDAQFSQGNGQIPAVGAAISIQKQKATLTDCKKDAAPNGQCVTINGKEFINAQITNPNVGFQNIYIFLYKGNQYVFSLGTPNSTTAKNLESILYSVVNSVQLLN